MPIKRISMKKLYKHSCSEKRTLLFGELHVESINSNPILIESEFKNDINIIMPKKYDTIFKKTAELSPITKNNITLYDQESNIINKWKRDRLDNKSGNVNIELENTKLLSNYNIPKVGSDDHLLIVFNDHSIIHDCITEIVKMNLLIEDLKRFIENIKDKYTITINKPVLIINKTINSLFEKFNDKIKDKLNFFEIRVIDIDNKANNVYTFVNGLAELVFGKNISQNNDIFQTFLEIEDSESNNEIEIEGSWTDQGNTNIKLSPRTNGRIQVTSFSKNVSCSFMLLLKTSCEPENPTVLWNHSQNNDYTTINKFSTDELQMDKFHDLKLIDLHNFININNILHKIKFDDLTEKLINSEKELIFKMVFFEIKYDIKGNDHEKIFKNAFNKMVSNLRDNLLNRLDKRNLNRHDNRFAFPRSDNVNFSGCLQRQSSCANIMNNLEI
jgi:hypothetical protein